MEKVGYIDRVSPMMTTGVVEKFAKEWSEVTQELKERMYIKRDNTSKGRACGKWRKR